MTLVESFLQYISSPGFADSMVTGVAGNAAYDAVKPTIEKIKTRLTGQPASEDDLKAALEELMFEIAAHTNLNINQLREDLLAAIGQGKKQIPRQLTAYAPIDPVAECIGRDEALEALASTLQQSPKVVIVNGLGGIGKTTLAKAWLQAAMTGCDHFAWIEMAGYDERSGRPAKTFEETVAYHPELGANLHLSFGEKEAPQARFRQIMQALRQIKGCNLLVIDNAGADLEQKDVRAQLPLPPDWQVLVTARDKIDGFEPMPLDRLSPPDAAKLFRLHFRGACPDTELEALLLEVDYHTLTVELLAKTLENHLGTLRLSELSARLRSRQLADEDLQRRIRLNHNPEETQIYVHLLTTFDCAGLDAEERLLLARLAALPPGRAYTATQLGDWLEDQDAPEANQRGQRALQETLLRLDRKGWLTRHTGNDFSLHRMIGQAVLYQLRPGMTALGVLVEAFTSKLFSDTSTNPTLLFQWIPFAEQLLATLPEDERGLAEPRQLMNNLALICLNLGQYEKARDLLESALASAEKNLGPEHPTVAVHQSNLAVVYRNLGQYEKARDLLESVLASDLKIFGPEHPTVAVDQSNLANVYRNLGQYEKARDLLESALASAEKNLGPGHPTVAVHQSNLANVYSNLGQYEKARDLLESALASAEKNLGPEHPTVAVHQSNLAVVYRDLGQYEKARALLESALASDLKNLGPEHPEVAVSQINLGVVFLETAEKEKAKALFQAAYTLFKKQLGEHHPNTQTAKNWLDRIE